MKTRPPALVQLLGRPASERKIGSFWLVEERGEGGYAPVWLAREMIGHAELRLAAVKLFAMDEFGPDKDDIVEEARALGRVDHPHVARFYALVIEEDIGVMGLAMELLAGRSLEARLSVETKLSIDASLSIGIAMASALAAVHQAGIVHRDVKPGNIVEDARGVYKLIDFGIASASDDSIENAIAAPFSDVEFIADSDDATATATGMVTGTLGYVDPAGAGKRMPPTPARDLYALGATLYRCLSGLLPAQVEKNSDGHVLWDPLVLSGKTAPRSLLSLCPDIPPSLATLVDRLISPRPEHRPRGALHVEYELERIRHERGGRKRQLPPEDEGPFRGLRRFESSDRDVFFGRRDEFIRAMELLRSNGLVALVGPSGSGKSSLARAALLPAFVDGELAKWPRRWDVVIVEPGLDPWGAIVNALKPLIPEAPLLDVESLVAAMAERANDEERGIVVFVDQLEELVTTSFLESRDEAAAFLAEVGESTHSGVRTIVAARSDLLESLLRLPHVGKILSRSSCVITPLRANHWRESIMGALDAYGYELEDQSLEDELFGGIDRVADAMPLVEFALAEMWHSRDRENKRLTRASFSKIGGIEGALELHAEATVLKLKEFDPNRLETIRMVLLALTTPEGTRRVRTADALSQSMGQRATDVIFAFSQARLLVPTENGLTLAHEALLTHWSRLRSWINEARADRMMLDELERDAGRWELDKESVERWTGRRLAFARELVRKEGTSLSKGARHFIESSIGANRRRNAIVWGMAVVLVLALAIPGALLVHAQQEPIAPKSSGSSEHTKNGSLPPTKLPNASDDKDRVPPIAASVTPAESSSSEPHPAPTPVNSPRAPTSQSSDTTTSATHRSAPRVKSSSSIADVATSSSALPVSSVAGDAPVLEVGPSTVPTADKNAMGP